MYLTQRGKYSCDQQSDHSMHPEFSPWTGSPFRELHAYFRNGSGAVSGFSKAQSGAPISEEPWSHFSSSLPTFGEVIPY